MAPQRGSINPRNLMAPLAAFTMACVLFVWTRSSIQAAKVNRANKAREYRNDGPPRPEE
ncbi:hypothetical protein INS49_012872 [Diaporthe citri]|uniref:uncharacterized protein n=1 Tax=Diaporthe citri TaxID=83186 RepID=UPI001C7E2BFD|nr:uncharacterized protein INS49_012872 [Diaporthe citri]KAG6359351.1 hypothetical protein INS49_012872 [Diaporthe citri]